MSEPTDTSSPAPHPRGSISPNPSWGCFRLEQRQGPGCIAWYLVDPEECHPSTTAAPQKANRPLAPGDPCFPTHFQINRGCQLPCPADQLGPQICSHPCLTCPLPCHGHKAMFCCTLWPRCFWSLLTLPSPSSRVGLRGRGPPLPPASCVHSGPRTLPKHLQLCCLFVLGHAVCLSGSITIL